MQRQSLGHEILLDERVADQDQRRLRPVIVELANKRGQHFLDRELAVVAREIGAVAPIMPASEEKDLDAGMTSRLVRRDDIGIADAGNVNVLVSLHERE